MTILAFALVFGNESKNYSNFIMGHDHISIGVGIVLYLFLSF
jgi:hypothetical protein